LSRKLAENQPEIILAESQSKKIWLVEPQPKKISQPEFYDKKIRRTGLTEMIDPLE